MKINKEKLKTNVKKYRPYIGLTITLGLILICTSIVFLSVVSFLALPFLWVVFTAFYHFNPKNRKIAYCLNATRLAMWVYFSTIFFLLIYTPHWLQSLSRKLEDHTWWNMFKEGSFMCGRTSVAFVLSSIVLLAFFFHYRWTKKKEKNSLLLTLPPEN